MNRYLYDQIQQDLNRKMVFLGGPRQVGKTTLAKQILKNKSGYLNWDVAIDRENILKGELPATDRLVFDEIHKYRSWRNYLKGLYDSREPGHRQILVTGSARLDLYRFGGDSLQGRYHFLRLHPLSAAELKMKAPSELFTLLRLGGFPEPFLSGSDIEAKRWSREYRTRLIQEDIASLERLQDLGNLELLIIRLPELVGSPLSINSLREDLQVSHQTLSKWVGVLERMYAIFRLSPFGSPRIRAEKNNIPGRKKTGTVIIHDANGQIMPGSLHAIFRKERHLIPPGTMRKRGIIRRHRHGQNDQQQQRGQMPPHPFD